MQCRDIRLRKRSRYHYECVIKITQKRRGDLTVSGVGIQAGGVPQFDRFQQAARETYLAAHDIGFFDDLLQDLIGDIPGRNAGRMHIVPREGIEDGGGRKIKSGDLFGGGQPGSADRDPVLNQAIDQGGFPVLKTTYYADARDPFSRPVHEKPIALRSLIY